MTLSSPALKSVTDVVAALAVQVKDPVLFSFPSRMLLTTWLTSRGLSASVGSRRKLASAKSVPLYIYALSKVPVSREVHAKPVEPALIPMKAKPIVSQS